MVVKNHKDSIAKSLEAVKDKIDSWILVDTGSTDGTLDIAKNILSQVPGQILISRSQTPHKDTLYWAQSEANYVLLVDPQEELFFSEHFVMPSTDHDYYLDYTKQKVLFVKNSFPWDSIEGLKDQEHKAENILSGVVGSWSFFPFLPFAFAQSYIETKEYGVAKRILESSIHKKLETSFLYPALYQKAILSELLGEDLDHVLKNYGDAFVASSNKAEPLFRMSVYACNKGHYPLAYSLIKTAASMPRPQDRADNEDWIYDYGIAFAWGNCALGMKKYEEAKLAYEQALDYSGLSESVRQEILENLKFAASDFLN
jgi:tetratricopeptide (TPR) repeat protein